MTTVVRRRLDISGVVQGVGFRPFVHRLAVELGLVGYVRNEMTHVHVEVEGPIHAVEAFEWRLTRDAPPLARIDQIDSGELPCGAESGFDIEASTPGNPDGPVTVIPPDTAVCEDCLRELFDPADRRHRYPFVTCTNCGPRFTIITRLPYDRSNTTMRQFELCPLCEAEYHDPTNRRYHAEPVACDTCGPSLRHERDGQVTVGTDTALARVHADLLDGRVVAIKGLGGYHLAVDATDGTAVQRLRDRKDRLDKPFAVMVADLDSARGLALIDAAEAAALESPASPIVLLRAREDSKVSPLVAPGNPLIGVMLAYTPLHHLLFRPAPGGLPKAPEVLVMTSGNVSGEPICFDDGDARARLGHLADSFCVHDRPIHVPCDDSVVRLLESEEVPLRRSRGFAPLPVRLPAAVPPTLATGGEIKNTFALASGHTAWISQHHGDMENLPTLRALESSVDLLAELYHLDPETVVADAHPGYRIRRWAVDYATGREVVEVQHHHAHLASLMTEHGLDGSEPVMGFVFDGTGYGNDGAVWGGEVLVGDYRDFERWGHLAEVPLPGADSAVRNPCWVALAHLAIAGITWSRDLAAVRACTQTELRVLDRQLETRIHCPASTSMGRLFDAISSLLDVRHRISYEAQAAIELEALGVAASKSAPLRFGVDHDGTLDARPLIRQLVEELRAGADQGVLARGFHEAVVEVIATCADTIRNSHSIDVVGLTGGVFQNALLMRLTRARLAGMGFEVLTHRVVPANDGGLALGQVMVAAHRRPISTGTGRGREQCA